MAYNAKNEDNLTLRLARILKPESLPNFTDSWLGHKYKGGPLRNHMEPSGPHIPSISFYGIELPDSATNIAYFPVCEKAEETVEDLGVDKFGGKYLYQTEEMKEWPLCDQCHVPMTFMFAFKDPSFETNGLDQPVLVRNGANVNTKDHVQVLMCINKACPHTGCVKCKSDGPCFKVYKYDAADPNLIGIESPVPSLPFYRLVKWDIKREIENYEKIEDKFKNLSTKDLEALVRKHVNLTDAQFNKAVAKFIHDQNKYRQGKEPKVTIRDILLQYMEEEYHEKYETLVSPLFKVGGNPMGFEFIDDFDDYIQFATMPYFPFIPGEEKITLHLERDGSLRGDHP